MEMISGDGRKEREITILIHFSINYINQFFYASNLKD
jgi:hypothetical protein